MDSSINNGMCRCCAAENTFKDLHTTYQWMGDEEIYSTMLRDCFNVDLITSEEGNGGICEVCITQLRNAANFKKQVLHTEEQFRRHLQDKPFKTTIVNIVKQEYEKQDVSDDDSDRNMSDDFSPDFEIPIKQEPVEVEPKTKSKKRAASVKATATVTKAKKAKIEVGESSTRRKCSQTTKIGDVVTPHVSSILDQLKTNVSMSVKKVKPKSDSLRGEMKISVPNQLSLTTVSLKTALDLKSKKIMLKRIPIKNRNENIKAFTAKRSKEKIMTLDDRLLTPKDKMKFHTQNMKLILLYSNATPIRVYDVLLGYACAFCSLHFQKPAELKEHSLGTHKNEVAVSKYMRSFTLQKYVAKLDVTGLKCDICSSAIDRVETLIKHFNEHHGKMIYLNLGNHILPFDFSKNVLTCFDCLATFESFKVLLEHMNTHYKNFICDVCAKFFVTKKSFETHKKTHRIGEFQCESCDKVFDTYQKKKTHEKSVHLKKKPNKCLYCDMKFVSYGQKMTHMTKAHGTDPKCLPCSHCEKTFVNKAMLNAHVRKYHLLERPFACDYCGLSFFRKRELLKHMIKHTGLKEYKCEVCHKEYSRRETLREHVRIHANDRRFKCERCEETFIQKCKWKGHMKSKHGETV